MWELVSTGREAAYSRNGASRNTVGTGGAGSRIVSVDGVDLTGLDAREARMVFGKLTGTAFALRFVTPSVTPVLLDSVDFFEDKTFDASKAAASAWCEHSGVVLASVETVNRGRQGDRIRLWYNKLDRRNLRPAGRARRGRALPGHPPVLRCLWWRPAAAASPDAAARLAGRLARAARGERRSCRSLPSPAKVDEEVRSRFSTARPKILTNSF